MATNSDDFVNACNERLANEAPLTTAEQEAMRRLSDARRPKVKGRAIVRTFDRERQPFGL